MAFNVDDYLPIITPASEVTPTPAEAPVPS